MAAAMRAGLVGSIVLLGTLGLEAVPAEPQSALVDTLRSQFGSRLQSVVRDADGVIGYVIVDVTSGERFEHLAGVQFPTASTIKLAVLYELLKQAEEGRVALDDASPLDRSRAVPGGLLYELGRPSLSARDLATAMILQSDNTATNVLIARIGMQAVNDRMSRLGLSNTKLRRYMIDREAALEGDENVSTPSDMARLVLAFHHAEGLSAESAKTAQTILKKPKRTPIRTGVPADVEIASKSGELEGVRADAGIVYVSNRPYVLVVMGTFLPEGDRAAAPLESLALASYEYFSRRATLSSYGRQLQ